jgi:hypothetical protein
VEPKIRQTDIEGKIVHVFLSDLVFSHAQWNTLHLLVLMILCGYLQFMLLSNNASMPAFLTGPHRGTRSDIKIWRKHMPQDLQDGERGLADGAYQSADTVARLTYARMREWAR